jgi:hypothetical protein
MQLVQQRRAARLYSQVPPHFHHHMQGFQEATQTLQLREKFDGEKKSDCSREKNRLGEERCWSWEFQLVAGNRLCTRFVPRRDESPDQKRNGNYQYEQTKDNSKFT